LAIEGCPLSEIVPIEWALPPGEFDGILLGSANALQFGGDVVDTLVDKPVYAVGEATAAAARRRGFEVIGVGNGRLQSVLDAAAGQSLRLLRIAGRERVAVSAPPGLSIETVTAYETRPLPLPEAMVARLNRGAVVLLHSAASARQFAAECERLAVQRRAIRLAAMAPRIADAAGAGWALVRAATEPNEAALLALAADLCHEPPSA
jgi:uroporphyrinogen-III synthase